MTGKVTNVSEVAPCHKRNHNHNNNNDLPQVVDFGAFVDVGLKHSGFIHRSQLQPQKPSTSSTSSSSTISVSPLDVLAVGDDVTVKVLTVEPQRGRISLSLKQSDTSSSSRRQ